MEQTMRRLIVYLIVIGACATAVAVPLLAGATTQTPPGAQTHRGTHATGSIAFMRPGEIGEYDDWAVRPDGSGLRRLTKAPLNRADYDPRWSPDGSRVLFDRAHTDGLGDDLFTVQADGTGLRQLTNCDSGCWSDESAAWSADGRRIAFTRATGPLPPAGVQPSKVAVYVMNANGSGIRQVTRPEANREGDRFPTWSRDGATIVFQRDITDGSNGRSKLMAIDLAGGAERLVYRLPDWAPGAGFPKFSPDGKRILFHYWCIWGDQCPEGSRAPRNARLATIRPDGTGLRVLRLGILADSGGWAPDGRAIVFRCQPHAGPPQAGAFRLCTSRLDGSHLKVFPIEPLNSVHHDWGTRQR
jgi:TolB protein